MVRARQVEAVLSELGIWTASDLDQRMRRLREVRMLPQGGRGLNAPSIEPEHAATMLLALAGDDRAVNAHHAVQAYAPMVPVSPEQPFSEMISSPAEPNPFCGCPTFAEALTAVLADAKDEYKVQRVAICRTWPEGVIEYKTSDGATQTSVYRAAQLPKTGYGSGVRVDVTFRCSFLAELAGKLAGKDDDDSGDGWPDSPGGQAGKAVFDRHARERGKK